MKREIVSSEDAKRMVLERIERQRNDYDRLWAQYRQVVHECAELHEENGRLRRKLEGVCV